MNKIKTDIFILTSLSISLLTGCNSLSDTENNPQDFHRAMPVVTPALPATPQIIRVNPHNLAHTNTQHNKNISDVQVIKQANQKALISAKKADATDSIIVFPYTPGNLYEIYTTPLNITDIALQAGEQIISFGAGDTSRWQISRTASGAGGNRIEHLVVKPLIENIDTTMMITTDRRTYHVILKSTKNTFMAAVQWQYADQGSLITNNDTMPVAPGNNMVSDANIPQFDFAYHVALTHGDKPDWYPTTVFSDGMKTYIEFPTNIQSAPALFIKDSHSGDAAVNYRVLNNYYVIDQVITAAELSSGNGDTQVTITAKKQS